MRRPYRSNPTPRQDIAVHDNTFFGINHRSCVAPEVLPIGR